jgi:hypothetical protein
MERAYVLEWIGYKYVDLVNKEGIFSSICFYLREMEEWAL